MLRKLNYLRRIDTMCRCKNEEIDISQADERPFKRNILELSSERKKNVCEIKL